MKKILSMMLVLMLAFTIMVPVTAATQASAESASVGAKVDQLNGNQNRLWITVTDVSGSFSQSYMIPNNAAGTYQINSDAGNYMVYVDTKGNTQIRACYIVSFFEFCDTVIKNGDVRTMDGNKTAEAVGIKGGKLLFIGTNKQAELHIGAGTSVIDVKGSVVAPGFIDIHTHADSGVTGANSIAENYLRQGVTTVLGGNCGGGSARSNVATHLTSAGNRGTGVNYGTLVGHQDLRSAAGIPNSVTNPSPAQVAAMEVLMDRAMREGAFGLSTGLEYDPFTSTYEVIATATIAAQYGGFYATHSRDERLYLLESVAEAIEISEQSGAPLQYSHIKADASVTWPKTDEVIGLFRDALARGLDVTADIYPYTAWSTGLSFVLGPYSRSQLTNANNNNPALLAEITDYVKWEVETFFDSNGALIQLVTYTDRSGNVYNAYTLADILAERGVAHTVDNVAALIIEILIHASPSMIGHGMSEENVVKKMQEDFVFIGSDGSLQASYRAGPHPRNYGTFPRVLGHYVRDTGALTLEQALFKMTVQPAKRLLFTDRGMLKEGYWADITVFNPNTVGDNAGFDMGRPPSGIDYVLVNGVVMVDDGVFVAGGSTERPGQILYGPGRVAN